MYPKAYAAEKAGWNVALADRPGNKPLPEGHHFPVVDSLLKLLDGTDKFAFPKDIQVMQFSLQSAIAAHLHCDEQFMAHVLCNAPSNTQ